MSLFAELNYLVKAPQGAIPYSETEQEQERTCLDKYTAFQESLEEFIMDQRQKNPVLFTQTQERINGVRNINKLRGKKLVICGVGSIGRPLVEKAVAVGMHDIHIYDYDTVGLENNQSQGYSPLDALTNKTKIDALRMDMLAKHFIDISIYNKKVEYYQTILDDLNTPDFIVVGTDTMHLKNRIVSDIFTHIVTASVDMVPELCIITSMALGAFNVYVIPAKYLAKLYGSLSSYNNFKYYFAQYIKMRTDLETDLSDLDSSESYTTYKNFVTNVFSHPENTEHLLKEYAFKVMDNYLNEAFFQQSEGVQEPCNARSLNYTVHALSSYLMPLLQDWVNNPINDINDIDILRMITFGDVYSTMKDPTFRWAKTFNTLTFTSVTPTRAENLYKQKMSALKGAVEEFAFLHRMEKELPYHTTTTKEYASQVNKGDRLIQDLLRYATSTEDRTTYSSYWVENTPEISGVLRLNEEELSLLEAEYPEFFEPFNLQVGEERLIRLTSYATINNIEKLVVTHKPTGKEFTTYTRSLGLIAIPLPNIKNYVTALSNHAKIPTVLIPVLCATDHCFSLKEIECHKVTAETNQETNPETAQTPEQEQEQETGY